MLLPAASSFVHRPNEAELPTVSEFDHARFAVEKAAHRIWCNAHSLAMFFEEGIKQAIAIALQQRFCFHFAIIPPAEHLGFAQFGDAQIIRVDIHIADNFDVRNEMQRFARHLKQRTGKISGNPLIASGTFKVFKKHGLIKGPCTRGKTPNAHRMALLVALITNRPNIFETTP